MKQEKTYRRMFFAEKNPYEAIVTILLFMVFILAMITGVLSYVRLNRIIGTVNSAIRHDYKLAEVKDIYKDILEAETRMKAFEVSGRETDFARFAELTGQLPGKTAELKNQVSVTDTMKPTIDTFAILVEEKINNLEMMLILQDNSQLLFAMDEVLARISSENVPSDPAGKTADTTELKDSSADEVLNSMMSRRRDKIEERKEGTLPVTARPVQAITLTKLGEEVEKIKRQAMSEGYALQQHEMEWIRQDRIIMQHIRDIIERWDLGEEMAVRLSTQKAERQVSGVRQIIVFFGIATLLFLFLGAAMVLLYFRRNKEYRLILLKARNDAEDLAQAKERFLASMSHEIKTPMNVISGYLSQVLKNPLENEQRGNLEIVKKSADHLLLLLNNLLDLSKLQADKLELVESDFSPAELLREIHRWFMPAAENKNLLFNLDIHPELTARITGDPVRMRQILANLVDNAIKFTDAGEVTLRAYISDKLEDKAFLVVEVSDTGPGIGKDDLENIFLEFGQGQMHPGKKSEGTGLGLAIASKLAGIMGGNLNVESAPGKGSKFTARIPIQPMNASQESPEPGMHPGYDHLAGKLVLVVDDEAYNRSLLKLILGKYKCRVLEAADGEEAVMQAGKNNPDLVLMDIRMPGISGIEAAIEIKKRLAIQGLEIPVIALSAGLTHEEMKKYRQSGIDDFIPKPFEEEILLNSIISLISHKNLPLAPSTGAIQREEHQFNIPKGEKVRGYDLGPLRKSCNNDTVFFREMVGLFLQNTDSGLSQMEELLNTGSMQDIGNLAHRISAPCRQIRAEKLYSLIKQAERQAENSLVQDLRLTLKEIRMEFEHIRTDIQTQPDFNTEAYE